MSKDTPAVQNIRRSISDSGYSQKSVAIRMGISQKHLSDMLTGKSGINAAMALRFENALGVSSVAINKLESNRLLNEAREAQS